MPFPTVEGLWRWVSLVFPHRAQQNWTWKRRVRVDGRREQMEENQEAGRGRDKLKNEEKNNSIELH